MKWKPILASLVVIAIALGAMAAWKFLGPSKPRPSGNAAANAANAPAEQEPGKWMEVQLEPRMTADPSSLWPRHGMRMASPQFWVVWTTREHVPCRVLARGATGPWYEVGHTRALTHYLALDLTQFNDEVFYCVEWQDGGHKYRSQERWISFGAGACYERRQYKFVVPLVPEPRFRMRVQGRELSQLRSDSFTSAHFPEGVHFGALPTPADGVVELLLADATSIPLDGCFGFLEMYDRAADTYDLAMIDFAR
jgi:hypothetical protein